MGAIAPVLGTIGTIGSLAGSVLSAKTKSKASNDAIAIQQQENKLASEAYEQERRDALKRAVSKQRARIGASGSTMDGSGEAILLGLFQETDEEIARRNDIDKLKDEALRRSSDGIYTRSLLDVSDIFSDLGSFSSSKLLK